MARSHARKRPWHARHARDHYRESDSRRIYAAPGQRSSGDSKSVRADGIAEWPRRAGTDQARVDRRLGISIARGPAQAKEPKRIHGRHRRYDTEDCGSGQEIRIRYDPWRFRHIENALPKMRQRSP